jgi:Predicted hydrolases or acyltransferases (alpha/beta hydrolase superfamily)
MQKTIAGTNLHYLDEGSGFPILWIHGFPLSSALFQSQLSIGGYRHIVPDLPGFGESDPPKGEQTIESYARLLLTLLDGLDIRKAAMAGVSMGGYVLLAMMRFAPERVAAAILSDTKETADTPESRAKRYQSIEDVKHQGTRVVVDDMFPKMLTPGTIALGDARAKITRGMMEQASTEGVVAALAAMAERPDEAETLVRSASIPTLIVVGEKDPITTPADASRMHALAPSSEVAIIREASHLSNVEQPRLYNEAVQQFLDRTRGRIAAS